MSPEKMAHFNRVAEKARKVEGFLIDECRTYGIAITAEQARKLANIVIEVYGNNTPPAPVDVDENIGS